MSDPQPSPPAQPAPEKLSYEQARAELASVVERLESGGGTLEESLALWERGEQLYRLCRERLDAAQGRIEELAKRVEESRPAG